MGAKLWAAATNLLCVRLDSLGDVLMTTPALRALKESRRDRRITLLTSLSGAAARELVPEIDEILEFQAPWMKHNESDCERSHALIRALRDRRFDAALIFTVYSQSPLPAATICHMAEIPLRLAHCRENPYHLLTDWVREPEPHTLVRHEVRRQLDLVGHIGSRTIYECLRFRTSAKAAATARRALADAGVDRQQPWVVVHPGASAESRRWPPEYFAEVAHVLSVEHGFQVAFTGTAGERALVEQIRARVPTPTCSLAGQLPLAEFAALVAMSPLLISNNTAPVHIAAGVGTPVVDIYAMTNPQHTPWQVAHRVLSHDVPCRNCYSSRCPEDHHDCLRRIAPAEVIAAVLELWSECRARKSRSGPVSAVGTGAIPA